MLPRRLRQRLAAALVAAPAAAARAAPASFRPSPTTASKTGGLWLWLGFLVQLWRLRLQR